MIQLLIAIVMIVVIGRLFINAARAFRPCQHPNYTGRLCNYCGEAK